MIRKNKIVAIQADPLDSINIKTDTTLLLALEAQKRGFRINYCIQTFFRRINISI